MPITKSTIKPGASPIDPRKAIVEEEITSPSSQSRSRVSVLTTEMEALDYEEAISKKCIAQQEKIKEIFEKLGETLKSLDHERDPINVKRLELQLRGQLSAAALEIYEFARCERAIGSRSSVLEEFEERILAVFK